MVLVDRALDRCRDVLPTRTSGLLAASCLPTGDHAREAFRAWLGADDDLALRTIATRDRELLSCVEAALTAADDAPATAAVRTRLRAAGLLEDVRGEGVAATVGEVLEELAGAGVLPTVVGGCAFAERIHGGFSRRHCGGLDLVVAPGELEQVRAALDATATPAGLHAVHESGFGIHVADRLFRSGRGAPSPRSIRGRVAGHGALLLDDEWALVHTLGAGGLQPSPTTWWVPDAGTLVVRRPALDWARVTAVARGSGVALGVLARLTWLRDHAGVPVPGEALEALRRASVGQATGVLIAPRRRLRGSRVLRAARSAVVATRSPR